MIRTIVQLTDDQWVDARELARLEGLSLAAFVRLAVEARLARARSARLSVRQRALAALDGVQVGGRGRDGDQDPRQDAGGAGGESGANDSAGGREVPRYWLEQ